MAVPGEREVEEVCWLKQAHTRGSLPGNVGTRCAILSQARNEYVPLPDAPLGGGERRQLSFEESLVLAEIDGNALSLDALAERLTNLSPGRVAAALSSLEVDGIVLRLAGGKYLANTGQATIGKGQ
jgi:predicted Rossmann fold nucleotide-binding protein DprA/Smf involved in DNA uptake